MSEPLKPCPTCGSKAKYVWSRFNSRHLVHAECTVCGCRGPIVDTTIVAAKAWETLPPSQPKPDSSPDNKEPKRCPFCGGRAKVMGGRNKGRAFFTDWFIICEKCLTSSNNYNTEQKAVEAWNRRVSV